MLAETVIHRRRELVVMCACLAVTGATQYCVRERVGTRVFELLTVPFRPFCLPRKFGKITVILFSFFYTLLAFILERRPRK